MFENVYGKAYGVNERGHHATFSSALEKSLKDLLTVHDSFYDSLADQWSRIFPKLPARPGKFEDGVIFLYVKTAALSFMVRPKLRQIEKKLAELPGAPKKVQVKLLIHD